MYAYVNIENHGILRLLELDEKSLPSWKEIV